MTELEQRPRDVGEKIAIRNNWLKIGVIAAIILFCGWKLVTTSFTVDLSTFRFTDLLSLILGIFSISLSALFYFRATETSNRFYENTFQFTKDVSVILGRIEAGFGERLRHIDEGYSGLRERFDQLPIDKAKTEEEIAKQRKEQERVEKERSELLETLAKRAKLQEAEKTRFFSELQEKDSELRRTRRELAMLNGELSQPDLQKTLFETEDVPGSMISYLRENLVPKIETPSLFEGSLFRARRQIDDLLSNMHPGFVQDAKRYGLVDDESHITPKGMRLLRRLVMNEQPSIRRTSRNS